MNRMRKLFWKIITKYGLKRRFKSIGINSVINKPLQLDSTRSIVLENNVYIAENAWLMGNAEKHETLRIGEGTVIGHYSHIIARKSVTIENNVLIADKVFISDCTHAYEDPNVPVIQQSVNLLEAVKIGEGSWLGENVCVCGASVGKHCVIGANSVVKKDIPDYCVAVGSPARIVKRYDFNKKKWVKAE